MFAALGSFVYRYRWAVIAVWVVIFAISLVYFPRVSSVLKGGGFDLPDAESGKARAIIENELGASPLSYLYVIHSDTLTADDPAFKGHVAELIRRLKDEPGVKDVSLGNTSADRHTLYLTADLDLTFDDSIAEVPRFRALVPDGEVHTYLTGSLGVYHDMVRLTDEDLRKAETYTFPIALVVMLFVFGTLVAAGMPLVMGFVSISVTLAAIYFLTSFFDMSIFVMNSASMIGLGVGIDYSLLTVNRFREEIARGNGVEAAVSRTLATAGVAIFFSGLTVVIGLSGLLLLDLMIMRSLAIGGSLVVVVAVSAALTLMPAILSVLGRRINALNVLPRRIGQGHFWHNLSLVVMRRSVLVVVVVIVALGFLASPVLGMKVGIPDASALPARMPSRIGLDIMKQAFGEAMLSPVTVVVRTSQPVLTEHSLDQLYTYVRQAADLPNVAKIESVVTLDPSLRLEEYKQLYTTMLYQGDPAMKAAVERMSKGNVTVVNVIPKDTSDPAAQRNLARELRQMSKPDGFETYVGGHGGGEIDFVDALYSRFPLTIAYTLVVTYLVLLVLFRSVVLPLKAVIVNTFSVLASYGIIVFVFQHGNFANILNFSQTGQIEAYVPVLMFCVLFGLSMDYEVFLLTRVREEYLATGDNTQSVANGLEKTGRIITSAAMVMVVVAGAFTLGDLIDIKELGVGLAMAILLDATIIRALLVPAAMRLLGDWNWWAPGFIRRVLPAR